MRTFVCREISKSVAHCQGPLEPADGRFHPVDDSIAPLCDGKHCACQAWPVEPMYMNVDLDLDIDI